MARELLTPEELAAYLKLSPGTIRNWTYQGKIPHIKLNGTVRFDKGEIDLWMAGRTKGAQA